MNNEDEIIEEFFQKMKEEDDRLIAFPLPLKRATQNWTPYAVAASILVLLVVNFMLSKTEPANANIIHISFEEQTVIETQSLLTNTSIEDWESPTQSLIADF